MPHNNKNDHWGIRRIHFICAISIVIYLSGITALVLTDAPKTFAAVAYWSLTFGWGGFFLAVWLVKPDWRCRLPAGIRAVFFRTLEHPWEETRRVGEFVEEYCARCEQYRHGRMTAYGGVEGDRWQVGPLEARSS